MALDRSLIGKAWRFLATGLLINGVLYGLFWLLLRLGMDYRIAATTTFVLGVLWGYTQNRLWSWRSKVPVVGSTLRYFSVYGVIYVLHMAIVTSQVELWHIDPLIATLVSIVVLVVPNFIMLNLFVFRRFNFGFQAPK